MVQRGRGTDGKSLWGADPYTAVLLAVAGLLGLGATAFAWLPAAPGALPPAQR